MLLSMDKVIDYGDTLNIPQADERDRKVTRKEVMLFDKDAYREAGINAFVHNSWVNEDSPMFTGYRDRIEIESIGTIPPKQTKEGFYRGKSVPVNKKLSELFIQLHISEKSGRGVPRIIERYGKEVFAFLPGSILVTIPFDRIDAVSRSENTHDKTENTPVNIENTPVNTPVSSNNTPVDTYEKILNFCSEAKGILEIADMLGYKEKKSVRKFLYPLIAEGRIAMTIPDKPNSRNQKYITIKR
ncbi:MAG: hypothetical protein K6G43_11240 [Lachnospiraceae bacterium]|nr:hypothetical protein [Lachnospiraceae bacterium]